MTSISQRLNDLAGVQKQKAEEYGEGYKDFGRIALTILGPIKIESIESYNRYMTLFNIITKIMRYTKNIKTGHRGSTDDLAVYSCILQELDDDMNEIPF